MDEGAAGRERLKETARTFLRLLDQGRYDELATCLSENVVYRTIGRAPVLGASDLLRFYRETRTVGAGVHEVTDILVEGNKAAVILRMRANLPSGEIREFGAVDLFLFEGSRISEIRTFIDLPPAPSELTSLRK